MSTFKLSRRGGIKIGVFVSTNISLHLEKHRVMSSVIPAYVVSSRA